MTHSLSPIFEPCSVAVVGASQDTGKRGHHTVRALRDSGYSGTIYPVNPKGGELLGLHVWPSIDSLPEAPDLAFIATPAEAVPGILEACGSRGVRGAVVPAVGFRESGPVGVELERRLAEVALRTGIRVLGPNTSGVLNTAIGLNLVGLRNVRPGRLALLAQSGNVAIDLMNEATSRPVGISLYAGLGNETDLAFHECLDFLETHEPTATILVYVEGFRDGRLFIEAASRVGRRKPIVLLKGGRSESGRRAARSHTGVIAGSYPVFRAVMAQAGVIEVARTDELLPVAEALAGQPPAPSGQGFVVMSDGGGHATIAADALTALGVGLARLSVGASERLRTLLGRAASAVNPVDLAGAADRELAVFPRALEIILADPAVGGVLLIGLFGGYAIRFDESLAAGEARAGAEMCAIAAAAGKPLVLHSLYSATGSTTLRRMSDAGVPVVGSLEVAARCAWALDRQGQLPDYAAMPALDAASRRAQPEVTSRSAVERERPAGPPDASAPPIEAARAEGREVLTEVECRELLADHGVRLVPAIVCRSEGDVADAISKLGTPAVLKLVSPSLPHKTEAGAVVLDIDSPEDGVAAFQRAIEAACAYAESEGVPPDIRGALVSPMLPPPVAELIVGVRRDEQFGPVITVAAGGVAVELLGDATIRALPIDAEEGSRMLAQMRLAPLLEGYRGRARADREALVELVLGLAACALEHPQISELEVNPVFVYADRTVAVDVGAYLGQVVE